MITVFNSSKVSYLEEEEYWMKPQSKLPNCKKGTTVGQAAPGRGGITGGFPAETD